MLAWSGTLDAEGPLALSVDPPTGAWARLPRAPSQPVSPLEAVWTGREMIVLGGGLKLALRLRA